MNLSHPTQRTSRKGLAGAALAGLLLVLPGFSDESSPRLRPEATEDLIEQKVACRLLQKKAEEHFGKGNKEGALELFGELVEMQPENDHARGRLAYLLIGAGRSAEAVPHLEYQLEHGEQRGLAAYNLACAQALQGHPEPAIKALKTAVGYGFHDAKLMASDPDLESLREQPVFAKLVKRAWRSDELQRSLASMEKGKPTDEQLAALAERASIVTWDGKLQHDAGYQLIAHGLHAEGEQAFERQALSGYAVANAHYNVACCRALQGDTDGAIAALAKAVELGMHHPEVRADADLVSLHDDVRYAVLADKLAATDGSSKHALKMAVKAGDLARAETLYAELAETEEPNPWFAMEMGRMLLAADRPEAAAGQFALALESGHEADDAIFYLASASARQGDDTQALKLLESSLTLGYADAKAVEAMLVDNSLGDTATRTRLVSWAKHQGGWGDGYEKGGYDKAARSKATAKSKGYAKRSDEE